MKVNFILRLKLGLESEVKKLKETVARLEKSGGLPKAPESGQLNTLRQERDKLQKEKDNLTTDLKKVCHTIPHHGKSKKYV